MVEASIPIQTAAAERPAPVAPDLRMALQRRTNAAGLLHLAGHLALLTATGSVVLASRGSGWIVPALLAHGVVLIFLFAPLHETIHRTAFASRRLNDAVAWACGAVLLLPANYFRYFHFAHHRFTQDPSRDPELAVPKPRSLGAYLVQVSGWPYWRAQVGLLVRHALGRVDAGFIPPRGRPKVIREARILLGCYAVVAAASVGLASDAALLLWVVPALLGQPFLRLYLLAEHTGCPEVPDMLANTRTTLTTAAVRFLAWNMPYHVEHHLLPSVPFHALPKVHDEIRDRIGHLAPGYVSVHRDLIGRLLARHNAG
jgi:fatty acid desaturase